MHDYVLILLTLCLEIYLIVGDSQIRETITLTIISILEFSCLLYPLRKILLNPNKFV